MVEVVRAFVQALSQVPPDFFLYPQRIRGAVPVTEEDRVSLPLPAPDVTVSAAGVGGRVGNVLVASSVEQPLSLYAL